MSRPYARTEISRKSCIPSSLSLWNSLDSYIRSSNCTSHFKSNLKRLRPAISKVPSFYLTGDRYLSVLHARIRNKCSNLNNDLLNNHLSPTPLCNRCQETEDAEHFSSSVQISLSIESRCFIQQDHSIHLTQTNFFMETQI